MVFGNCIIKMVNYTHEATYKDRKSLMVFGKKYYENGQLESEINFKDGKYEGQWKWYYVNGNIKKEGNFKDGKNEGLWKSYYQNGQLKSEENYKDGG